MKSGAVANPSAELAVAEKPHKVNDLGIKLIPMYCPKPPFLLMKYVRIARGFVRAESE